jgi:hypothetical protein
VLCCGRSERWCGARGLGEGTAPRVLIPNMGDANVKSPRLRGYDSPVPLHARPHGKAHVVVTKRAVVEAKDANARRFIMQSLHCMQAGAF